MARSKSAFNEEIDKDVASVNLIEMIADSNEELEKKISQQLSI